ncbi:MAG: DMT family transporter [Bacillota bacterium]
MTHSRTSSRLALIQLHTAVFLFGLAGLFGKFLPLPPLFIVLGRTLFASLSLALLLPFLANNSPMSHRPAWKWLLLSGIVLAIHWGTFFHSIQISTVAIGLLTFSSFPFFVTLLEPWLFRERWRWLDLATACLVLTGLALIVPHFDLANNLTRGAFWGILSGLTFAILSLINRHLVATHPPILLAACQNLIAALALAPFVLPHLIRPDLRTLLLLAILGILCTALAHVLFIKSLAHVRAQLASTVAGLESVYGITLAFLLLGEVPSPRTLLGGTIVLAAVILATLKRPQPAS